MAATQTQPESVARARKIRALMRLPSISGHLARIERGAGIRK
jgi:hypothetical protein